MENGEPNNNNNNVRNNNQENDIINSIISRHLENNDEYNRDSGIILPRTLSDISRSTMRNIAERRRRGRGRGRGRGKEPSRTCIRVFHDKNSSPKYRSLPPGWLCEERTMQYGRLYKYFYGPDGKQYNTKSEVEMIYNNTGLDLNKEPK